MKKYILLIVIILGVETSAFANTESSCSGYDSQNQSWVTGTCNGSMFQGYDQKTGTFLSGTCSEHGMFQAYNYQTHSFVYGNCF